MWGVAHTRDARCCDIAAVSDAAKLFMRHRAFLKRLILCVVAGARRAIRYTH